MRSTQCSKCSEGSERRDAFRPGESGKASAVEGIGGLAFKWLTWFERQRRVVGQTWAWAVCAGKGEPSILAGVQGTWRAPGGSHGQALNHVSQSVVPRGDSQDDFWWYMMVILKLGVYIHVHWKYVNSNYNIAYSDAKEMRQFNQYSGSNNIDGTLIWQNHQGNKDLGKLG